MITTFKNNETGYSQWLRENQLGFVFNHFGGSDRNNNILHRASCDHLKRPADEGRRTMYAKIVGNNRDELGQHVNRLGSSDGDWWKSCSWCCP